MTPDAQKQNQRSESMKLRIAMLMMQKNESLLLEPWIRYDTALTAASSIFIFDNGSSDPRAIETLNSAEKAGIRIVREHAKPEDYLNTGTISSQFINQLDTESPHDFYFPIDCDEFLACLTQFGPSFEPEDIEAVLTPYLGSPNVLTIPFKYYNNPYLRNQYTKNDNAQKCFFAQGTCGDLSHGFHEAKTHSGSSQCSTPITYFEFHYKPYQKHRLLSFQKIENVFGSPQNISRKELTHYAATKKINYHCPLELLQT